MVREIEVLAEEVRHTVIISDAPWALLAAKAAGRAVIGVEPGEEAEGEAGQRLASAPLPIAPELARYIVPGWEYVTEELAELLRAVTCRERDDSYTEYAGQAVTFTLHLTDGTTTRVMAYSPFLVIDGAGYRTDQAPCEALNAYANRLLETGAEVILESPPALAVVCGDTSLGAMSCGYAWHRPQPDGSMAVQMADSPHPLELRGQLEVLETDEETAVLRFTQPPDALSVCCWRPEDVPGDMETPVTVRGMEIQLEPGERIYQAEARWDGVLGGGTAWYAFAVRHGTD